MTTARWSMPRRIAGCSTLMAVWKIRPTRCGRLWETRRAAREAVETHRIEVERAQARGGLSAPFGRGTGQACARVAGEETALADKRAGMMAAEKIAERSEGGARGSGGQCLAGVRFRRRDPAARTPPGAGAEPGRAGGEGARRARSRSSRKRARISSPPCRRRITIRPNSSGSRNGCFRCAPPGANTICRSTASPRWRRNMPPIWR